MQYLLRNANFYKFLSLSFAIFILSLGLFFSITHTFEESNILSFCILISAVALILQLYLPQYHLINIAGIVIILAVAFFISQIPIGGALGFICVGIAFLLKTHAHRSLFRTFITFALSAFISFIGFIGIVLYLLPIAVLVHDQVVSIIHLYASMCLIFVGISLMCGNIYLDIKDMAFFWDISSVHKAQLVKFFAK